MGNTQWIISNVCVDVFFVTKQMKEKNIGISVKN